MIQIDTLSGYAKQQTTVKLDDNTAVVFTFTFHCMTQRWVFDVVYGDKTISGLNLCVHPNLLRSYRNILPFGLDCVSTDGEDPFDINDFVNERITLSVLDDTGGAEEIQYVEDQILSPA